jgi:signal transduction histidine kinase
LFYYQERLKYSLHAIAHIQETLSLIHDLQNNIADTEAICRGYILTGEEGQLKLCRTSTQELDGMLKKLDQLMAHEPGHQSRLEKLRILINQRQVLLQKSIELRQQKGLEVQEHAALAREGTKIQDKIRQLTEQLEESEKTLLQPHWAEEKIKTQSWLFGLTIGALLSFALLLLSMYFLSREINERKEVQEQLAIYQGYLRSLASQLTLAEERERRRIAVHLHDDIAQSLTIATIRLRELQKSAALPAPDSLTAELDGIGGLLEQAIRDTQSLTFKISPPILYELGLEAALEWLTEELQQKHGLAASFASDHKPKPLDHDLEVLLFQAVSELLVNVVKHAKAARVKVSVAQQDGYARLEVADDGVGFDVSEIKNRWLKFSGFGLFCIRERLEPFGGSLEVESAPGAGARVILSAPLA